jgi:hypothetical protein
MAGETEKFIYEDEADKEMGVETASYENGGKVKRVTLSDGRVALVRRLKGRDMKQVEILTGNARENALPALMAVSTKVADRQLTLEEIEDLWAPDYNKLRLANVALNF